MDIENMIPNNKFEINADIKLNESCKKNISKQLMQKKYIYLNTLGDNLSYNEINNNKQYNLHYKLKEPNEIKIREEIRKNNKENEIYYNDRISYINKDIKYIENKIHNKNIIQPKFVNNYSYYISTLNLTKKRYSNVEGYNKYDKFSNVCMHNNNSVNKEITRKGKHILENEYNKTLYYRNSRIHNNKCNFLLKNEIFYDDKDLSNSKEASFKEFLNGKSTKKCTENENYLILTKNEMRKCSYCSGNINNSHTLKKNFFIVENKNSYTTLKNDQKCTFNFNNSNSYCRQNPMEFPSILTNYFPYESKDNCLSGNALPNKLDNISLHKSKKNYHLKDINLFDFLKGNENTSYNFNDKNNKKKNLSNCKNDSIKLYFDKNQINNFILTYDQKYSTKNIEKKKNEFAEYSLYKESCCLNNEINNQIYRSSKGNIEKEIIQLNGVSTIEWCFNERMLKKQEFQLEFNNSFVIKDEEFQNENKIENIDNNKDADRNNIININEDKCKSKITNICKNHVKDRDKNKDNNEDEIKNEVKYANRNKNNNEDEIRKEVKYTNGNKDKNEDEIKKEEEYTNRNKDNNEDEIKNEEEYTNRNKDNNEDEIKKEVKYTNRNKDNNEDGIKNEEEYANENKDNNEDEIKNEEEYANENKDNNEGEVKNEEEYTNENKDNNQDEVKNEEKYDDKYVQNDLCKVGEKLKDQSKYKGVSIFFNGDRRFFFFDIPPNEIIERKNIKIIELVSEGSFGVVYKAIWNNKIVAVKKAHEKMSLEAMRSIVREMNTYRSVSHDYIIQYYGVCIEESFIGIVIEYLSKGNVFDILYNNSVDLSYEVRLNMAIQLVRVVNYLHENEKLVHRDLKTSNLLLDEKFNLKLCDFGKTRKLDKNGKIVLEDNGGSPRYMAPECFIDKNIINEKADIWGLACCLIEIFGGLIPFQHIKQKEDVIIEILLNKKKPEIPNWFHPDLLSILERSFCTDPNKRPSCEEYLKLLLKFSSKNI
ncbi:LOW QUALITY PROTEIN: protein kinase, putative [Plasmodium relictum]|uniref:Protein kinase, putative n=1 Tax=Plasmodium relictum TaxID=85471 RepID=A0A1J1H0Z1_PLARL|nr:LOW QUALITY PROTEIN: protein kinase, putative [Plasmodium relictum]CRG98514.1 protein kinase, putative [Plasmodium relictum]